jgi:hypothetical protein
MIETLNNVLVRTAKIIEDSKTKPYQDDLANLGLSNLRMQSVPLSVSLRRLTPQILAQF